MLVWFVTICRVVFLHETSPLLFECSWLEKMASDGHGCLSVHGWKRWEVMVMTFVMTFAPVTLCPLNT